MIVQETLMTPAVTINATVQAGGVHEPSDRTGLAYLAGRVLDRGTAHRIGRRPGRGTRRAGCRRCALPPRATRRSSAARACRRTSTTCWRSSSTSCARRCFPSRKCRSAQAECHLCDPAGRGQPVGPRGRDALRDALRRVASVRPPGQGNGRDASSASRAPMLGGVPCRAVQAGGAVAGDRRPRRRPRMR